MNLKLSNKKLEDMTVDLLEIIPKEELTRVLNQNEVDIDPEFLWFIHIYKNLSEIIPKHFTVIDLGCAYAPQTYYFSEHKEYIGVDVFPGERFSGHNTDHYIMGIEKFCKWHDFDPKETFAICSYVGKASEYVRGYFENVFTFYPHGGEKPVVRRGSGK